MQTAGGSCAARDTVTGETWPKVSVILVNYNSLPYVGACVKSVLAQTYPNFEVILVDNCSVDGSLEYVSQEFPNLILVPSRENLGYARGINAGLSKATGKYIAPLNVDTEVAPDWLAKMVEFMESHPQAGAVTPKILLMDDRSRINTMGHNDHISGLSFCRRLNDPDNGWREPERVTGISGCSYLIRKEVLEQMGGEPDYSFMSNDDTIMSWLLKLMGYELYCVPEAVVYHRYELRMDPDKLLRLERDRLELVLSVFSPGTLVLLSPVLAAVELMTLGYSAVKGREYLKAKYRALASVWRERAAVRARRRQYRQLRAISDWRMVRGLAWGVEWRQVLRISKRGGKREAATGAVVRAQERSV